MNRTAHTRTGKKRTAAGGAGWTVLSALFATLITVLLLLLTALIIKNFNPADGVISVISTVIKIIGCFLAVNTAIRKVSMQPMLLGLISAVLYILLSAALFIALGGTQFDLRTLFVDVLLGAAAGVLFGLVMGRKSKYALNK